MKRGLISVLASITGMLAILIYILLRDKFFGFPVKGSPADRMMTFQCISLFLATVYNTGVLGYKFLDAKDELKEVKFGQSTYIFAVNTVTICVFIIPAIMRILREWF